MKLFSLILNTRGRAKVLDNFLFSLFRNTADEKNIEVLIRYDKDDSETEEYFRKCSYNETIQIFSGDRPDSLNESLNDLARKSKGQYVFVLNDDVEILTPSWDEKVLDQIKDFKLEKSIKDDIIYGYTHDTSADKVSCAGYASFPIISKQAIDILGFVMYPDFVGLGGDSSIYRVYKAIDRVVDTKIGLDHVFHNSVQKVMSPDLTASEMRSKSWAHPIDPFTYDISLEVQKLKSAIEL